MLIIKISNFYYIHTGRHQRRKAHMEHNCPSTEAQHPSATQPTQNLFLFSLYKCLEFLIFIVYKKNYLVELMTGVVVCTISQQNSYITPK